MKLSATSAPSLLKWSTISLLLIISFTSNAGLPSGPYLAWINLHEESKPQITQSIREFLKTQQDRNLCDGFLHGWIVYTHKRPEGLSNKLASQYINHHDKSAKQSLIKTLKLFRDPPDVEQGLDGLIIYSESNSPHIVSLDTYGKFRKSSPIKNPKKPQEIIDAFCSIMPEVYRQ